jgi:hypothetical protein
MRRSHDQFYESRTAFDVLTSAVDFDLETTFSTSNASFSTSVKESYQVVLQLPTATGPPSSRQVGEGAPNPLFDGFDDGFDFLLFLSLPPGFPEVSPATSDAP